MTSSIFGLASSQPGEERSVKLAADGVAIRYPNTKARKWHVAVEDATFSTTEGAFVSIIGPSGCGKSSLLRAIGGLTPYYRGSLLLDGREIHGPGEDRGFVFQAPQLLPWRSVLRNVTLGLEVRGTPRAEADARAREVISLVGLEQYEQAYPAALSGGMQQRVNLARAIVLDPDLLLLDEPFSALDAQTREVMGNELLRILSVEKRTALFVTHQIEEAVFLADQVIVLSRGPGSHIKRVVDVALPRPRTAAMREEPEFVREVAQLRSDIFDVAAA
jgi:NitT/TauT family transport system ATP-binding protein